MSLGKITLKHALKLNPKINPELFLPDPRQVLEKLDQSPIRDWLNFMASEYELGRVRNLILIPCSFYKPYHPPHDEFYRRINELRGRLVDSKFITVSVPLALEPEEFWSFQWRGYNLIYDCPFFPWIERFGYKWDFKVAEKVYSKLKLVIDSFFKRNKGNYERVIAFFLPSYDELKLVEKHVTDFVLSEEPNLNVEVSYDNNTSEIYCHPKVWRKFMDFLKRSGILKN